jgi:type IV pilus assembly protein PilC
VPKFFYVARDKADKKITGVEESSGQEEIIARLQGRDLVVVSVLSEEKGVFKKPEAAGKSKFRPKHYGITSWDLVLLCRQLAILLGAGVTILKSLDIISKQVSSRKLYNVIKDLEKNMEAGKSFHEAMSKHPAVFSDLWVNLVESGEASGNLAIVLNRLATYLERNASFKKKVISSLMYPAILMTAGIGALLFLTLRIIPTFGSIFAGFKVPLPVLTQALLGVSAFIRKYGLIFIAIMIIGFFLLKRYTRTKDGRMIYEKFKFSLPVFGDFFRGLVLERFSSEMSTLVESGVPILYSLEITEHSVGNLVMSDIIRQVKEDVREGKSLSEPLDKSGFFEPMVVQMIGIGEEIGELSQMFKRINTFYQEYVETFLTRFTSLFEPLMLIFMGIVIGLMVVGMFLPIFQIARISG